MLSSWFARAANVTGRACGQPIAFVLATTLVIVWAVSGPIFGYSDTWQLVINTGTTVLTFLLVFVIQNTANRNADALHIKLDELIRALPPARTEVAQANLENASEAEIEQARAELRRLEDTEQNGA